MGANCAGIGKYPSTTDMLVLNNVTSIQNVQNVRKRRRAAMHFCLVVFS